MESSGGAATVTLHSGEVLIVDSYRFAGQLELEAVSMGVQQDAYEIVQAGKERIIAVSDVEKIDPLPRDRSTHE